MHALAIAVGAFGASIAGVVAAVAFAVPCTWTKGPVGAEKRALKPGELLCLRPGGKKVGTRQT